MSERFINMYNVMISSFTEQNNVGVFHSTKLTLSPTSSTGRKLVLLISLLEKELKLQG